MSYLQRKYIKNYFGKQAEIEKIIRNHLNRTFTRYKHKGTITFVTLQNKQTNTSQEQISYIIGACINKDPDHKTYTVDRELGIILANSVL